jgi:hypothetical protein
MTVIKSLSWRQWFIGALGLALVLGGTFLTASPASASTYRGCYIHLSSGAVVGVGVTFTKSGDWETWSEHTWVAHNVYDAPVINVNHAIGSDGTIDYGPGGPVPTYWSGDWLVAPVQIRVTAVTASGGGGGSCSVSP